MGGRSAMACRAAMTPRGPGASQTMAGSSLALPSTSEKTWLYHFERLQVWPRFSCALVWRKLMLGLWRTSTAKPVCAHQQAWARFWAWAAEKGGPVSGPAGAGWLPPLVPEPGDCAVPTWRLLHMLGMCIRVPRSRGNGGEGAAVRHPLAVISLSPSVSPHPVHVPNLYN